MFDQSKRWSEGGNMHSKATFPLRRVLLRACSSKKKSNIELCLFSFLKNVVGSRFLDRIRGSKNLKYGPPREGRILDLRPPIPQSPPQEVGDPGSIRFQSSSILRYNSIPHFGERVPVMDLIGIKTTNTAPKVCTVHIRG